MTDIFEQTQQEYKSISPERKQELLGGYSDFKSKYSPEVLQSLGGEQLLDRLFLGKGNNENLCYYLEKDKRCKVYGGIGGRNSAKFGLYYSKDRNSWVKGKGKSIQELSIDEAIKEGSDTRDIILKTCEYISGMNFQTLENYEKLEEFKNENPLIKNAWIRKYLHMLFPDYFPAWYSEQMLEAIIRYYGEEPREGLFVKAGQVALIARKCNIPLIVFANLKTNRSIIEAVKVKDFDDGVESSMQDIDIKMRNIPLNQILYGSPGTGKTYNTIIEAMKILTFEELFKDWFLKIYCSNNKVVSQERVLGDYTTTLKKINEEFLINDNIFMYYELEQFIPLKNYILNSNYITVDSTKNNKNSYYQHALKRYEEFLMWLDYDKIREKFNEYKDSGRIEFITFHQSYSYEEFVEGIKPDLDKNCNDIRYTLNDGIFKIICKNAKQIKTDKKSNKIDFTKTRIFKMSLGANWDGEDIYNYCLNNNVVALGWGGDEDFSNCNDASDFKKVDNTWGAKAVEIFKNWMRIGDIILISNGNSNIKAIAQITGNYEYHNDTEIKYCQFRNVNWLYSGEDIPVSKFYDKKLSQQAIYGFYSAKKEGQPDYNSTINTNILNEIITGNINKIEEQPYVLIIDEINRGNISKIFGELITLIEDDKRSNFSVRLPYSQTLFTVPKNLYIIGTMNTSDRSIATIDIALRRRFTFIPKMPDKNLVRDKFNMKDAFKNLNKKIRILLDEDHQIGHSYFMNIETITDLKETWANKIIPLLNEYFYGDWTKLKLLIPGFISENQIEDKELVDEIGESCYYRFKNTFSLNDDDFIKATMGLKIETDKA